MKMNSLWSRPYSTTLKAKQIYMLHTNEFRNKKMK